MIDDRQLQELFSKLTKIAIASSNGGDPQQIIWFKLNGKSYQGKCAQRVPKGNCLALLTDDGEYWLARIGQEVPPQSQKRVLQYRRSTPNRRLEQYLVKTAFKSTNFSLLLGGYAPEITILTISPALAFTEAFVTNLGENNYLASAKYQESGIRKYLFESPIGITSITNTITSGNEYFLGNGLWESNSGAPTRKMIHDLELETYPVSVTSTTLRDSYNRVLSRTQINAYADTWTPENPSSRFSFTRNLNYYTLGEVPPPPELNNNSYGLYLTYSNWTNLLYTDFEYFSGTYPLYAAQYPQYDKFHFSSVHTRDTVLSSVSGNASQVLVELDITVTTTRYSYGRRSNDLEWELIEAPTDTTAFTVNLNASPGSGVGTLVTPNAWNNPAGAYGSPNIYGISNPYGYFVDTYDYTNFRFVSGGFTAPYIYSLFLSATGLLSPETEKVTTSGGTTSIYSAGFSGVLLDSFPREIVSTDLFIWYEPEQGLPDILEEDYTENYQGIFLQQQTTNGYVIQNFAATKDIHIDRIEGETTESFEETQNTLTLKYDGNVINLNTANFLVIHSWDSLSAITSKTSSFTLTSADTPSPDFSVAGLTGLPILFNKTIDNIPYLIKGAIASISYASGLLQLQCLITEIEQNITTRFLNKLITANGSFWAYYFRNALPGNLRFTNRNAFKILPLNPIVSTFLSVDYTTALNNFYSHNFQRDNIIDNSIYSVVEVVGNTALIEQWDISESGLIQFNTVFETPYIEISNFSGVFSHSFNPG